MALETWLHTHSESMAKLELLQLHGYQQAVAFCSIVALNGISFTTAQLSEKDVFLTVRLLLMFAE